MLCSPHTVILSISNKWPRKNNKEYKLFVTTPDKKILLVKHRGRSRIILNRILQEKSRKHGLAQNRVKWRVLLSKPTGE